MTTIGALQIIAKMEVGMGGSLFLLPSVLSD